MDIDFPKFERGRNPAGVYRMTIDSQFIYIGCSRNLKKRFSVWKSVLKSRNKLPLDFTRMITKFETAKIEVIEIIEDVSLIRRKEMEYLWELSDTILGKFILNRNQ